MTEKKANEIFKTKYPEGEIVRKNASSAGSRYFVVFKEGGKVYYYNAQSYQELLGRFGFQIAYKHDIENAKHVISRLEETLRTESFGLCLSKDKEAWKAQRRAKVQEDIAGWKEELRRLTEDCIQA